MNAPTLSQPLDVELDSHLARFRDRKFDWHAFPSNEGYADLARAQARYVGAGSSPKKNDPLTLKPAGFNFTVSLIYQEPGRYAALHEHEVEESFLVFDGSVTVGWFKDGDLVEARLGPKDLISNAQGVPHGFRNDSAEPMMMSVMVGSGAAEMPRYRAHPKDTDAQKAYRLGVEPERVMAFDPRSDHPLQQMMARHLVRYADVKPVMHDAGFAYFPYVGDGGIEPWSNRKGLVFLPPGRGVRAYARECEDVYFVTDGVLTVGWEAAGEVVEQRLGRKDLAYNPPGRAHYFRNDGLEPVQFFMVAGARDPEPVTFQAR